MMSVEQKAKKASERRDKLEAIKKRRGLKSNKREAMSQDQAGKNANPAKAEREKPAPRRHHP